ncbi:MAG: hypothetical protein ACYC4L_21450 [Chloroflexota bacterium]
MMRPTEQRQQQTRPGVIDSLNAGFAAINRRLWIVLLPIAVDILIWRGPHLTALPLLRRLLDAYQAEGLAADALLPGAATMAEVRQTLEPAVDGFNLLSLLVLNFVANLPSFNAGTRGQGPLVVDIASEGAFAGAVLLLELAGLALGCFYLALIAQQVRDGRVDLAQLGSRLGRALRSVLGLLLLWLGVILIVVVPLTLLLLGAAALGGAAWQVIMGLAMTALYFGALWALVFLFFTVDAIMVSEVSARHAILSSVLLVRTNFRSALGLIFLTLLILSGTNVIWSNMGDSPWGIMAGVVGNAYIASGLTAASMVFYLARVTGLKENGDYERFLRRK